MRILHVIDHLGFGGAQVLLVNLCSVALPEGEPLGHEVLTLHGRGPHYEQLKALGVPVQSLAASRMALPQIVARLAMRLRRSDYDIVDLHLPAASIVGAAVAALCTRAPVCVNIHSLKKQMSGILFRLLGAVAPVVDQYIAYLPTSLEDLRSVGVPGDRVALVPMGLDLRGADPKRHAEARRALCARYRIGLRQPLLLSVARLSADRSPEIMVSALRHVVRSVPDAVLLLVGDGEERRRLEDMARDLDLLEHVVFAGARTDVWDIFPGCDVYLSMSSGCDIGVAALQAMACGRPVAAYNVRAMRDPQVLCEDRAVFIACRDAEALADSIAALLNNPSHADHMGRRARASVEEHASGERMVAAYRTVYHRLLSAPGLSSRASDVSTK